MEEAKAKKSTENTIPVEAVSSESDKNSDKNTEKSIKSKTETILFSPASNADPISTKNNKEGPMLQICREYRPSKVYLYLSQSILRDEEKDHRYTKCLEYMRDEVYRKAGETLEWDVETYARPDLVDAHKFDYFYGDFREILQELRRKHPDARLLLNVSSGTPAMESALMVLATIGEISCEMVQVSNPEIGSERPYQPYDPEAAWKNNLDQQNYLAGQSVNRCEISTCPTLFQLKQEEIIKKHIRAYDYEAALAVAKTMPWKERSRFQDLLEMATQRVLLNFGQVDRILKRIAKSGQSSFTLPVTEADKRKYFEYALGLDLKLRRKEWVDFVRGITPLLVDLFDLVLEQKCDIVVSAYTYVSRHNKVRKWSEQKLREGQGPEIRRVLDQAYRARNNRHFEVGPVYSDALCILIEKYAKESRVKTLAKDLRKVEREIRNLAAHDIVSITDDTIKARTGFTSKAIMDKIKEMFPYAGMPIDEKDWESYDILNKEIIAKI